MNKNVVLLYASLASFLMLSGQASAAFTDIDENDSYYEAITFVEEKGIVSGYADGTFKPDQTINRAEFTKIIMAAQFEENEINGCKLDPNTFQDFNHEEWFVPYVCLAEQRGILNGYPDGTFQATKEITFAEAAKIVVNGFSYSVEEGDPWYQAYTDVLEDREAVPPSILAPEQRVTRGEIVEIIYHLLDGEATAAGEMRFIVTVPANTMEGDSIWIYLHTQEKFKMLKTDEFQHEVTLTEEQIQPNLNEEVRYRYSRNGYDFHTAEYLEPDTNDYFWTEMGRETTFQSGNIQEDAVQRWRFFPEEDIAIVRTSSEEPEGTFQPRIDDQIFRSGQTIEDFYTDAFAEFFTPTAEHMKTQSYTWVEIDPPWQWIEVAGLPQVSNEITDNPNYPDDKTFLEEVKVYKQEGLKVLIAPQLCCDTLDTEDRSTEWWDAYYSETEKFLLHFAALAEEADADAFSYAIGSWETDNATIDIEEKWRGIFTNIREVFSGEVGEMIWVLGPDVNPSPSPIPEPSAVPWVDTLDFILVATEFPLSEEDDPTDEELEQKAGEILDGVKSFYDEFDLPILIRNGYFNVKYSWKGQSFYSISSIPWISDPESALSESIYEFKTEDQARIVQAYFKAIAERPWVTGYLHFGYTHWENPLSPWMSVRGKPAEDIWRKWNEFIYDSTELSDNAVNE